MYTNDYRKNLEMYWQQFYPDWQIPAGYHVHHIKPKCTFEDENNPRIHHPSNLIALHPDDHVSIHKCRGDKQLAGSFITSIVGRKVTKKSKKKMSKSQCERFQSKPVSIMTKRKMSKAKQNVSVETREKMSLAASQKTLTNKTKQKISEAVTGSRNPKFKGYYLTPWGKFESLDAAKIDGVSRSTVQKWCRNPKLNISKISVRQSSYLSEEHVGKTFGDIGFGFECINTNNNTFNGEF